MILGRLMPEESTTRRQTNVAIAKRLGFLTASMTATLMILASGTSQASLASSATFSAHAPGGSILCEMVDHRGPSYDQKVRCVSRGHLPVGEELLSQEPTLSLSGRVKTCVEVGIVNRDHCPFGNSDPAAPTLPAGKTVTVGRFVCKVRRIGVECNVTATRATTDRRGFIVTPESVVEVATATTTVPPQRVARKRA